LTDRALRWIAMRESELPETHSTGPVDSVRRWWALQTGPARATALGGAAIVLVAFLGVVAILVSSGSGEDSSPGLTVRSTGTSGILQPTASTGTVARIASGVRDAADEDDRPRVEADPINRLPLVRSLDALKQYGEPPDANFARLRIPSHGVNAPVAARKVGANGYMVSPEGPAEVIWYDLSDWGLGGTPGGGGNAVFSAHVDFSDPVPYANVRYQGVGVFFNVNKLSPGDIIEVDFRGQALRYAVEWRRQLNEEDDWDAVLGTNGSRDSITLITCSGDFDIQTRSYDARTVVRAVRL
jgi:hypothetical protein